MLKVKELPESDLELFLDIAANAYPRLKLNMPEERQKLRDRFLYLMHDDPATFLYGAYREGKLLGGMRLLDLQFTMLSTKAKAGGIGFVAVDMMHKKEGVAKELLLTFLRRCRQQGMPIAMLYPFRPDFYRQMGFGFVSRVNQYRIPPSRLPHGSSKEHIRFATQGDVQALLACYTRYADKTHGMIYRDVQAFIRLLSDTNSNFVVYERNNQIEGYFQGTIKDAHPDNPFINNLEINELLYEHADALSELLTFLYRQADQFNAVVFNVQDEYFFQLVDDPRNETNINIDLHHQTSTQGTGMMYRVVDVPGVFTALKEHNFGGQNLRLKLTIQDSFLPENAGSIIIAFEQGYAQVVNDNNFEVELKLDVADFSILLAGAISFRRLHSYGRIKLSDPKYIDTLQRLFAVEEKPICFTRF